MAEFAENSERYAISNFGAHKKPSPLVGAPSITRHIAFWNPPENIVPRALWHKSVDFFLCHLFLHLHSADKSEFHCPNFDSRENSTQTLYLTRHKCSVVLKDGVPTLGAERPEDLEEFAANERSVRYEVFIVERNFHRLDLKIRAEIRHEYWSLTFIADFSEKRKPSDGDEEFENKIFKTLEKLKEFFDKRSDPKNPAPRKESPDRSSEYVTWGENLFSDFAEEICGKIVDDAIGRMPDSAQFKRQSLGEKFGDFRGVILATEIENHDKEARPEGYSEIEGSTDKIRGYALRLVPPYKENLAPAFEDAASTLSLSGDRGLRLIDILWPAVHKFFESDSAKLFGRPEFTVSTFQDARTIYFSSLGQRRKFDDRNDPLRYILVSNYRSEFQLGRMVDRIHSMGTLRLAAIQDFAELQSASRELRKHYQSWRQLTPSRESSGNISSERLDEINKFAIKLSELEQASRIATGLMQRIDRSAYYVQSFKNILKGSRHQRLEGFLPYSDFVQLKMGDTFNYIQRIGERYRELRRGAELAIQSHRTIEMVDIQKKVVDVVGRMSSLQDEISKATAKGVDLLHRAEWFLKAATVYYLGNVAAYVSYYLIYKQLSPSSTRSTESVSDKTKDPAAGLDAAIKIIDDTDKFFLASSFLIFFIVIFFGEWSWHQMQRFYGFVTDRLKTLFGSEKKESPKESD